jgi:hypothetical protein
MSVEGTIVNGVVVLDRPALFPEGARVRVDFAEDEKLEYPHPMAPYDREKEIALLKESHEQYLAGVPGTSLEEVEAEMAREFGFPPLPRE